VQDDLQDNSRLRRGQASVAAKFGRDVALSLTDQLITTAFVCLSRVSQPGKLPFLISRINHAVSETVEGQTCELSGSLDGSSVERYLNAARKKSGPLFALSLELPLIFARHAEFLELAHEAACQFGLGYQILDDLKDQVSDLPGERSGNVVFALQKTDGSHSAEAKAAVMAQGFLQEASDRAESLPHDCGRSLIELVQILTPQIDAFTS
jgi:geranylgeranyl diphosphate synthase type II